MCVEECRAQGFAYAATQYSSYCFCGNRYGASGPAHNCNMPCAGNPGEICGGAWANSVYETGNTTPQIAHAPPPTPEPPPPAPKPEPRPQPTQAAGTIEVVAGSYGSNCSAAQFGDSIARGNVTSHLAAACNGKKSCDYTVDYTVIGDPAYGCVKTYVAEWRCGGDSTVHLVQADGEAGYGSIVTLRCAGEPAATPSVQTGKPIAGSSGALEYGTDRRGSDYASFDLSAADPWFCAARCASEEQCRAWTYVEPGVQAAAARCWLKHSVPAPTADSRTVSGVK